jgi:hypothetical protein
VGPAAQQISYEDLYARWETGGWSATALDFGRDRVDWREQFTEFERQAALWNYALFFWGEDAVADTLTPLIDAAPRAEQKYFLATQQADEARHAVFFKRFLHEVAGIGQGDVASGLSAVEPILTWGFRKTFELLDRTVDALRRDRSRTRLAQAVTMYHLVVEASLAQPGQHFIAAYLDDRDVMPGFRAGMRHVTLDEQRHIAFGVRCLYDLAREDPEVPAAVADQLRLALPVTTPLFEPPGGDRRYTEVFGYELEDIFAEGARSLEARLKAAGLGLETLPGPPPMPIEMTPRERAERGLAMVAANYLGEPGRPAARDPSSLAMLMDALRRSVDFRRAPAGPLVLQWDFQDAQPWHIHVENGSTRAEPGREAAPDITVSCRLQDWVDVMAGHAGAGAQVVRGRIRLRGRPAALWAARRLFAA